MNLIDLQGPSLRLRPVLVNEPWPPTVLHQVLSAQHAPSPRSTPSNLGLAALTIPSVHGTPAPRQPGRTRYTAPIPPAPMGCPRWPSAGDPSPGSGEAVLAPASGRVGDPSHHPWLVRMEEARFSALQKRFAEENKAYDAAVWLSSTLGTLFGSALADCATDHHVEVKDDPKLQQHLARDAFFELPSRLPHRPQAGFSGLIPWLRLRAPRSPWRTGTTSNTVPPPVSALMSVPTAALPSFAAREQWVDALASVLLRKLSPALQTCNAGGSMLLPQDRGHARLEPGRDALRALAHRVHGDWSCTTGCPPLHREAPRALTRIAALVRAAPAWPLRRAWWLDPSDLACAPLLHHLAKNPDWERDPAGGLEVARTLLGLGVPVNGVEGPALTTPLHEAAAHGREDLVRWLLAQGADVNAVQLNGERPIHRALQQGHLNLVQGLLDHSSRHNVQASGTLHLARRNVPDAVARHILALFTNRSQRLDPNALMNQAVAILPSKPLVPPPTRTLTVLHWAVKHATPPLITWLVLQGADPSVKDGLGQTVWDLAQELDVKAPLMRTIQRTHGMLHALHGVSSQLLALPPTVEPTRTHVLTIALQNYEQRVLQETLCASLVHELDLEQGAARATGTPVRPLPRSRSRL